MSFSQANLPVLVREIETSIQKAKSEIQSKLE